MDYLDIAEGRARGGLRLVLTAGVPGPWGEAAKAVLKLRGVTFAPVAQAALAPNEALVEWTGHRNAPVACLDDAPPLTGWLDILLLAERLGTGPSLLPDDPDEHALCLGYATGIAGPDGVGWNRRLELVARLHGGGLPEDAAAPGLRGIMRDYGMDDAAIRRAPGRTAAILSGLAARLHRQRAAGSDYLVGDRLSAADVYWACFSMMIRPLRQAVNPMPEWLRAPYTTCDPQVDAALDPILLAHRDRIYEQHIGLPLDY